MIRNRILITCLCSLLVIVSNAQNQRTIDSLHAVLEGQVGGERFSALYDMAFEYLPHDKAKALKVIEEACNAAKVSGDSLSIVMSNRVKGELLYHLGQMPEAMHCFDKVLPVAIRHAFLSERLYIESAIGRVYLFTGRYDKALLLFTKAKELAIQVADYDYIIISTNAIGLTYYKLKDYQNGLRFFLAAIDSLKPSPPVSNYYLYTNAALCYAHLGDIVSAYQYLQRSLQSCGQQCHDRYRVAIEYAFGVTAMMEGCLPEAEEYFLRSYALAKETKNIRFQLDNIHLLSELYLSHNEFEKARSLLIEGEELIEAKIPFNLEIIKTYSQLSEYYLAVKDWNSASYYQSLHISMRDSIYSEELINSLMKAEASFVQRESDAKIAAQERLIQLNDELLEQQGTLNMLSMFIVLLAGIVLLFLFKHYRKNKTLNTLLEERVKQRTRELELSRSELSSELKQQGLTTWRTFSGIAEQIATLRGLCGIARAEFSGCDTFSYFDKIDKTASKIEDYVKSAMQQSIML